MLFAGDGRDFSSDEASKIGAIRHSTLGVGKDRQVLPQNGATGASDMHGNAGWEPESELESERMIPSVPICTDSK